MSVFGDGTLEEQILNSCDEDIYKKHEIIRALLTVVSYIASGFDSDERTNLRASKN